MNKQHKKPRCDDMYRAILTLKTVDECKQFFDDLCTVTELQAMEQRYQVAQYLDAGLIYNERHRTGDRCIHCDDQPRQPQPAVWHRRV